MVKKKKLHLNRVSITIVIVVIGVGMGFAIKHYNHSTAKKLTTSSINRNTKGIPVTTNTKPTAANTSPTKIINNTPSQTTVTPTSTLIAPTGSFVSDHTPNLGGSPHPNTINSVCDTTALASCQIIFTNASNSTVESLPEETTDSSGAAYWNGWTLQEYNLTAGTWQVKAVSTLNGASETSYDQTNMVVSP